MSYFSEQLEGVLSIDPSADAVEYNREWLNWGQLKHSVDSIRARLTDLGLGKGSRVGVMIQNRPDSLAAILTVILMEGCIVSINPLLSKERLLSDLSGLKVPVIIGEPGDFDREGVQDALQTAGVAGIETEPLLKGAHMRKGLEAIRGTDFDMIEENAMVQMLTSGTTGTPKRIPLRQAAFEQTYIDALAYEKNRSVDDAPQLRSGVQLLTNPMTHIGGLWFAITTIVAGRKLALVEKFSVESWVDMVMRHKPKIVGAVPAALRMLLDANLPKEVFEGLVALRCGTAPLDPAVADEVMERYNLPVLTTYGATEFAGSVAGWNIRDFRAHWAEKRGSVGRFHAGVEARIVDPESGEFLPAGQEGVLEMKAKQFSNGEQWLRTTDRAVIDEDGFLFIKGRADNAIIRGGFKVHPDDVVKMIEKHDAVREAVVVGIPDRRLGSVPVAAIMLKDGATQPSEDELKEFVKAQALPYQVPVKFLFVDDVPRTPSMKPSTPMVRELFADQAA